jgi:hypothetical protein
MKPLLLLTAMTASAALAQGDAVLSGFDWVPQQQETLPHRRPVGTGFVSLPEAQVDGTTNWLHPAQWLETNEEGTTLNLNALLGNVRDANRLSTNAQVNLIGFGTAVGAQKRHFIGISAAEIVRAQLTLPGDVLRLPIVGNLNEASIDGDELAMQFDHFRRYTLGWQAQWTPRWSTGVRVHQLRGFEHVRLRDAALNWSTDSETFSWEFSGRAVLQSAGLALLMDSLDGNTALEQGARAYLQEAGSPGWGVDLGLAFHPNERWTLESSFTGMGRIAWDRELWSARWEAEPMAFEGVTLGAWALDPAAVEDSAAVLIAQWTDWADAALTAQESTESFTSTLPGLWLGQIQRRFPHGHSLQLAVRHASAFGTTCSAGATTHWGRFMQVNSTYTHGAGIRALGGGFAMRLGGLLVHAAVDNLLAARVARIEWGDDQSIWLPLDASRLHVRVGLTWVLGRPRKPEQGRQVTPSTRHPGNLQPSAVSCPDFQ